MNPLDALILVIVFLFTLKGLFRGLLRELCALAGLVLGAVAAFRYAPTLGAALKAHVSLPGGLEQALAFAVLYAAAVALFGALGALLSRLVKLIFLGWLNRFSGAVFGLAQGALIAMLLCLAFSYGPMPEKLEQVFARSWLRPHLVKAGEALWHSSQNWLRDTNSDKEA